MTLCIFLILATATTAALIGTDIVPLGVSGEWTWAQTEWTDSTSAAAFLVLIAGAVYIGFVLLGARRVVRAGRLERVGWIAALVVMTFGFQWVAIESSPPPLGYARVPWVLYYPRSSGYFWQARYDVEEAATFLAGYEELLAEQDYLHIGTHPPGLTLGYRGLLNACRASPTLTNVLLGTQPTGARESFAALQNTERLGGKSLDQADIACLWGAALLTQLATAVTVVFLYLLASRHFDRRSSWVTASLWGLVPAALVFLPKSDVLYALPAVSAAWLWLSACDQRSPLRAVLAGVVLWLGMLLSLAFVTVMALIGAMTLWEAWALRDAASDGKEPFLNGRLIGLGAFGFLTPTLIFGLLADVNLFRVWSWNLSNHALFYEHHSRTWWKWLLINPPELSFAVGLPIVVVAMAGLRSVRSVAGRWRADVSASVAFAAVWGLLWLSGKNMGEGARLWILLMPWVLLAATPALARRSPNGDIADRWLPLCLLTAQLVVVVVTILRIDGFHFAELLVTG